MNVGSRSDEETSQVGAYDFDRLERSVDFLIKEHERLTGERKELVSELVDREQRIAKLETQLAAEQRKRVSAIEGVDKILNRLEQLRTSVAAHATGNGIDDTSDGAAKSDPGKSSHIMSFEARS